MEFTISSTQILALCTFITAIWGVYKIVKEIKKPSEDLHEEVERHSRLLDSDNKRLNVIEQSSKMILQTLLVIINHDITGNGIDKMRDTRDKLQEYLIER